MARRGDDTIAALSSGQPPAAVAIVRTSGPAAFAVAEALAGSLPEPRRAALRILRDPATGTTIDQVLLLRFAGPSSATGEDIVEYQCHGGRAVVRAILDTLLAQPGMRAAQPGEFTRRALANGRIDLTEAEGLADLLEAETERQRRAALLRAGGGVRRLVEPWREKLLQLSARAEAAIDYVDEDETGIDVAALASEAGALMSEFADWLGRPRAEPLKQGIRVVVAGPPNAGKSSLINTLSGHDRAIVTDMAGTTRDVIEVPLAISGIPFVLVDTAGLREGLDMVERIGITRARDEVARADILLWLGDQDEAPQHRQCVTIHSRADEPGRATAPSGSLAVSSVTRDGIDALVATLVEIAGALLPGEDQIALNQRQCQEIAAARDALRGAAAETDVVILADSLRRAREALDRLGGWSGIDDLLDALFGRFCLGK
jgi:tRNA modification GTPase